MENEWVRFLAEIREIALANENHDTYRSGLKYKLESKTHCICFDFDAVKTYVRKYYRYPIHETTSDEILDNDILMNIQDSITAKYQIETIPEMQRGFMEDMEVNFNIARAQHIHTLRYVLYLFKKFSPQEVERRLLSIEAVPTKNSLLQAEIESFLGLNTER